MACVLERESVLCANFCWMISKAGELGFWRAVGGVRSFFLCFFFFFDLESL